MKLRRQIKRCKECDPVAMSFMSVAACQFAFEDGKADILTMANLLRESGRDPDRWLNLWLNRSPKYLALANRIERETAFVAMKTAILSLSDQLREAGYLFHFQENSVEGDTITEPGEKTLFGQADMKALE